MHAIVGTTLRESEQRSQQMDETGRFFTVVLRSAIMLDDALDEGGVT